ncbi:hypothetical protein HMN09_00414600 [Mycena chlorophos]|uniref:MFS general substrate transporter n=1 Tax=Mycena chlorophos TaxID=658473 RepID=A0A8H6TFY5_MYCCL|nr:hypothetical protein HMN09_00414600 [Mycena chlorophos]
MDQTRPASSYYISTTATLALQPTHPTSPEPLMAQPARINVPSTSSHHRQPSPLSPTTPAVTGIVYPSADASSSQSQSGANGARPYGQTLRRTSKLLPQPKKSIDASEVDASAAGLDSLWETLRRQKELKEEKSKPKVKSLEDHRPATRSGDSSSPSPQPTSSLNVLRKSTKPSSPPPPTVAPSLAAQRRWLLEEFSERESIVPHALPLKPAAPPPPTPPPRTNGIKKKKSVLSFMSIPEKNQVIAIFDLREVDREAIRISHHVQQNEITVSWEMWECETWTEPEQQCIVRQTVERLHYRILELADGVEVLVRYLCYNEGYGFAGTISSGKKRIEVADVVERCSVFYSPLSVGVCMISCRGAVVMMQSAVACLAAPKARCRCYHLVSCHHLHPPKRVMSVPWEPTEAIEDPSVAVLTSPTRSRAPHSFPNESEPLLGHRPAKKPFYRPRPLWLVPFACIAALVRGMTLAPRVEVFSQLSCSRLHHQFNHTESMSLYPGLSPQSTLDPAEFWVIIDSPPAEDNDEPWSDEETEDDPRKIPSARCMADAGVQADAARLQTMFTTTMGLLSAVTTGWWGRYGERHGRTRVLTFSILGLLLTDLIFILSSTPSSPFSSHGHKLLMVAPIIEGLLGGWSTLQSAISAYLSDCTSSGSRALVFSRFTGVLFVGLGIGPTLGASLIRHPIPFLNSPPHPGQPNAATVTSVFWVAVGLQALNLLMILFVVPESTNKNNGKGKARDTSQAGPSTTEDAALASKGFFGDFFSPLAIFLPVPMLVDGTVRKRKDWSLTLLASAMFAYMLSAGLYPVKYLYGGHVYGWGAEQLSYYISLLGSSRAVYLLVVLPFIIATLKPKPKTTTPGESTENATAKAQPTKSRLAKEIEFDLSLSRLSLCIEILACLAVVCTPSPMYKMHSATFSGLSSTDKSNSAFQSSQALFVFASWLQCMGSGAMPAVQSLALCILQARSLVSTDGEAAVDARTGTLFGALAVLQASGQMVLGPLFFGLIYSETVAVYPKTVFIAAAGSLFVALTALLLVRNPIAESKTRTRSMAKLSARRQRQISWEEEHRGRSRVSKDLRGYGSTNNNNSSPTSKASRSPVPPVASSSRSIPVGSSSM